MTFYCPYFHGDLNKNLLPGEWLKESDEASDREWRDAALLALRVTGPSRTGGWKGEQRTYKDVTLFLKNPESKNKNTTIKQDKNCKSASRNKPWSGRSQSRSHHMSCGAPPPVWQWLDSVLRWAGAAVPPSQPRAVPPHPSYVESSPSFSALPRLSEWLTTHVKRDREWNQSTHTSAQRKIKWSYKNKLQFLHKQKKRWKNSRATRGEE